MKSTISIEPNHKKIIWAGETLLLHPLCVINWASKKTIILADWHFGKIGHFRKAGIALPKSPFSETLRTVEQLVDLYKAERVLVLGDLFHSDYNAELDFFSEWRKMQSALAIEMVRGNHDILHDEIYTALNIKDLGPEYSEGNICFVHDAETGDGRKNRMCGHIHPGVVLRGKGRQNLRLPCFWFSAKLAVLPAFGTFTGRVRVHPDTADRIFVSAGDDLLEYDTASGAVIV